MFHAFEVILQYAFQYVMLCMDIVNNAYCDMMRCCVVVHMGSIVGDPFLMHVVSFPFLA